MDCIVAVFWVARGRSCSCLFIGFCCHSQRGGRSSSTCTILMDGRRPSTDSRAPRAARSEIAFEISRRLFGTALHVERRDEAAVLVHQVDDGGVVHGVAAAIGRDFLRVDTVGLLGCGDRSVVACYADNARIEVCLFFFVFCGGVLFWFVGVVLCVVVFRFVV